MGSPYLNSGEAIVLTTDRVSADALLYDLMLTTERIVLIDNRYARFEPRIIPLSAIMSVQGGKTPGHDPVITLLFRAGEGGAGQQPLNLVFSQNPLENRKPERDDWVRKLIELSVARQEKVAVAESPAAAGIARDSGLRPTVRHGIAPEKVRPLSNVRSRQPAPAPVTVIPDEVVSGGEIPVSGEKSMTGKMPEEAPPAHTPVRGTPLHPAPTARVIIPQIIEEERTAPVPASPLVEQEDLPVAESDHEALTRSIQTAVRSLTAPEEEGPESPPVMETDQAPERVPRSGSDTEQAADVPTQDKPPDEAEIISALHTGAAEPVPTEPPAFPEPEPAPVPESPVEASGTQVIIPQVIEEEKMTALVPPSPPDEPEAGPVAVSKNEALTRSIQTAVRSLTAREEGGQEPSLITETVPAPERVPRSGSDTEQAAGVPAPDKPPEGAEIISALPAGAEGPVPTEPPALPEPEPVLVPEEAPREGPESHGAPAIPADGMTGSRDQAAPEAAPQPESVPPETPPARHPILPPHEIRSRTKTLAYAAVLLLLIALVAAGAVLLFMQGHGQTGIPVTPATGVAQVTTVPPESRQTATPVPSITAPLVPPAGVWVRVNSTAYYTGQVGNPEQLQQVSGTGDHFYRVLRSNRTVQASVQKQDNSGALLSVEIYRDGTLIGARSVTAPMGTVDLLLNPVTGRPPGLTANDTLPEHAGTPLGRIENY
jgi:hypothetical protein